MTWRERFERARANGRLMDAAQVAKLIGVAVEDLPVYFLFSGPVVIRVDGEHYFPTEAFKRYEDENDRWRSEEYGASEEAEQNANLN